MKKIVDTRKGFTLAEILVSLLILGVIASLTIPSLIQNTQKKEEVVKIKKGLSMINQALSMNYSLTGQNLSEVAPFGNTTSLLNMFKQRLAITSDYTNSGTIYFITQDGLSFICNNGISTGSLYDSSKLVDSENFQMICTIITKPYANAQKLYEEYDSSEGSLGNLNGIYDLYCGNNYCAPSGNTAAIINADNPTSGSGS